jgi:predicted RNA-binding protein with PUA-like domain
MRYWLLKTEPESFSWDDLEKKGTATWDGVRNPRARNNIRVMKPGDLAFIYHTGDEKAVIGIARVETEAYPEPGDTAWSVVDLAPEKKLKRPVTLAEVKADSDLKDMTLARVPRLSVQSVEKAEWDKIIKMSNGK